MSDRRGRLHELRTALSLPGRNWPFSTRFASVRRFCVASFWEGPECRPEELENGLEWSYQNSCNWSLNSVNRWMCLTYRISCVDVELRVTEKAAKFVDVAFAYQREESLNVGAASWRSRRRRSRFRNCRWFDVSWRRGESSPCAGTSRRRRTLQAAELSPRVRRVRPPSPGRLPAAVTLLGGAASVPQQVPEVARLAAEHGREGRRHVRVPRVGAGTPHVNHVARLAHLSSAAGVIRGSVTLPQFEMAKIHRRLPGMQRSLGGSHVISGGRCAPAI